jgi:hypothetical protein
MDAIIIKGRGAGFGWASGTGGSTSDSSGKRIHRYNSSDSFVCTRSGIVGALVVGGGGGGGWDGSSTTISGGSGSSGVVIVFYGPT